MNFTLKKVYEPCTLPLNVSPSCIPIPALKWLLWILAALPADQTSPPHHVQFSLVLHQAGDGVGREHAGRQREVGVDHRHHLRVAGFGNGGVEARPEHPEEDGSWWRKEHRGLDS